MNQYSKTLEYLVIVGDRITEKLASFFAQNERIRSFMFSEIQLFRVFNALCILPVISSKGHKKLNRLLFFTRAVYYSPLLRAVAGVGGKG